jgi:pimeloyl-ACP methyl ester carboxylesterase
MPTITPDIVDFQWGPDVHQRLDVYLNQGAAVTGGHPVLIYRSGGGAWQYDKRRVSIASANGNAIGWYLTTQRTAASDQRFHFIAVNTRQARWTTPISTAGFSYDEPRTKPCFYPESFLDMQRSIQAIKQYAPELGNINPGKVHVMGSSYGSTLAMWSQLAPPLVGQDSSKSIDYRRSDGRPYRTNSRAVTCINHIGQPDFRFDPAAPPSGQDTVYWDAIKHYLGTFTQAEFDAVPSRIREAMSPQHYIENGDTRWYVPILSIYREYGGGGKPYGDDENVHHEAQGHNLDAALEAAGLDYASDYSSTDWNDGNTAERDRINLLTYDFMVSRQ